jgi:hypothetical protein
MSAKPETTFYNSVHKHLPVELYHMKTHNPFVAGVPDVWYSGPRGDMWVEYKFIVLPKRDNTLINIGLSELQKDWLRERDREGRCCRVIVGCKEGGVMLKDWTKEICNKTFKSLLVSRKKLADSIIMRCL